MSAYTDLRDVVRFVPLDRPLPHQPMIASPFTANFTDTAQLLAREIRHLRPREALLEIDMPPANIRNDGMPRADRRARTDGVVLTLVGTPHGDLRYPANRYDRWQDNVRAIALALEALRKVDRYGVTRRGEQYAGWKQLGAGGPSAQRGHDLIKQHGSVNAALMATHPDHGGDATDFADVQEARKQLNA